MLGSAYLLPLNAIACLVFFHPISLTSLCSISKKATAPHQPGSSSLEPLGSRGAMSNNFFDGTLDDFLDGRCVQEWKELLVFFFFFSPHT